MSRKKVLKTDNTDEQIGYQLTNISTSFLDMTKLLGDKLDGVIRVLDNRDYPEKREEEIVFLRERIENLKFGQMFEALVIMCLLVVLGVIVFL